MTKFIPSRAAQYWLLSIILVTGYLLLRESQWRGSAELHTLMETVATLLALFVGFVALARYYSRRDTTFVFIGCGFIGTAFLDGYHALVTSVWFYQLYPSELNSLIPWSWVASRFYLSVFMCLSLMASWHLGRGNSTKATNEWFVFGLSCLFTLSSFAFFAVTPLPAAYYPQIFLHRPQELIPAIFFALALCGYLRSGRWRFDTFNHWLVLSLIVGLIAQLMFMSTSSHLFDFQFDAAHVLKKLSYLCVLIGLLVNLTQTYRHAEAALAQGSQRRKAILDNLHDALIITDLEGRIETFSAMAEQMFGHRAQEILGQHINLLMPPDIASGHDRYLAHYRNNRKAKNLQQPRKLVAQRADGSRFPIELTLSSLGTPGSPTILAIIRDISEHERLVHDLESRQRLLEQSNAELEQFAYVASHDLQEPLRMVASFVQLISQRYQGQLDSQAQRWIGFAVDGTKRMKSLIEALLSYSRVSTQGGQAVRVELGSVLAEVQQDLMKAIVDSGAEIKSGTLPVLLADHTQLRQLLQNLIGNSLKYRSDQPPVIELDCELMEEGWKIRIRDNGIGIEPRFHARVFQIFQRLHGAGKYSGTGIGLAVCKRIVERHGGRIWVESIAAGGTAVLFTMPDAMSKVDAPVDNDIPQEPVNDHREFHKTH